MDNAADRYPVPRVRQAIAAIAVALPLLTAPGLALATEADVTSDNVVSTAIAASVDATDDAASTQASDDLQVLLDTEVSDGGDDAGETGDDAVADATGETSDTGAAAEDAVGTDAATGDATTSVSNASLQTYATSTTSLNDATVAVQAQVSSGVYELSLASDATKRVDVASASTKDAAKVQAYTSNCTAAQLWYIAQNADGYYTLKNVNSGKFLDVKSANATSGATVQQYAGNGTKAQQWAIYVDGAGYYVLRSRLNEALVLSTAGAAASNGTSLQVKTDTGATSQRFGLVAAQQVEDGVYTLTNEGSGKVLDIKSASLANKGNVQQYTSNGTQAQCFYVHYDSASGYYTLTNVQSGKVLDVASAKNANGTNVQQYTYNGTKAQKWALRANDDGSFSIYSALGGRALDVKAASQDDGGNVQIYASNGTGAQKWGLTQLDETEWLAGGTYTIVTSNNTSSVLTINSDVLTNGSSVVTGYKALSSTFSKWQLVWDGSYVKLVDLATGKALDVKGASTTKGAMVQQYTSNDTLAQRWIPTMTVTGLELKSALGNNLVLDVKSGSTAKGATLQTYTSNGTLAQRFSLIKTTLLDTGHCYTIRLADGAADTDTTDYVLDVTSGSTASGALIQTYASNDSAAQHFVVVKAADGTSYRVQNIKSAMYLTSMVDSVDVTQTSGTDESTYWVIAFDETSNALVFTSTLTGLTITTARPDAATVSVTDYTAGNVKQGLLLTEYSNSTLSGIDISAYQKGIDLSSVAGDFVIVKATQGTSYTNPYFKTMADAAIASGKLLGVYHFTDTSRGAAAEANYFYSVIKPYVGKAVLVLDWENNGLTGQDNLSKGVTYAKTFLDRVYTLTGVKPLIYMSRSVTTKYDWSSVANAGYKLWVAQYLNKYYNTTVNGHVENPTLSLTGGFGAWTRPTIYQYTSKGKLSGYSGSLDLDVFYGSRQDWTLLASK